MSDADATFEFCEADVEYEFDCLDADRTYNIEYVTADTDVGSLFVLQVICK